MVLRGAGEEGPRTAPTNVLPWLDALEEPSRRPTSRQNFKPSQGSGSGKGSSAPPFALHSDEFISTPKQGEGEPAKTFSSPSLGNAELPAAETLRKIIGPRRAELLVCFGRTHTLPDDAVRDHPPSGCSAQQSGVQSSGASSTCTSSYYSDKNVVNIGNYAAEELFGPGSEGFLPLSRLKEAAQNFVNELITLKRDAEALPVTCLAEGHSQSGGQNFGSSSGGFSRKRKADGGEGPGPNRRGGGDDNDQGDKWSGRRGKGRGGADGECDTTANVHEKNERLEFMCPFRLKNPMRFNVRDWYDCAAKSYICDGPASKRNELNELRRHIKQKHSGPGILTQPYCSICKEEFLNATVLDEHARMRNCLYRELPSSHDPLDGLSPEAERALTRKQGRQGDTALNQYRQICQIVLGENTEIPSPGEPPLSTVAEHFAHLRYLYLKKPMYLT
ncbi:hypothetical protein B0T14DRAFT_421872 [Immersiella caudata]|uniref:C2H2-type domain-containing protein n=1 Tax=Immersiella caudata TaxID=314043 RepID=A0AA40C731_9PEZI|nr:hypothetical protein B0T14DRAFT_421872 [Immersiella caudata]